MINYDFKSLSPWAFEQLSRDLLKATKGMDFEVFKEGQDKGIDLRFSEGENDIIVQCKHYAKSTFSTLLSNLKNEELPKVKNLNPSSYILVTSLGLTPGNKDKIQEALTPYIKEVGNIVGNETLNAWLREHPEIEKKYFNLWACSVPIMERILHSGIYNYTESQTSLLKERLEYYVKSPNFEVAQDILKQQHFCIIAGAPGIGKTTLAEMLMIDYMSIGYDPIKVSADIEEAFKLLNTNSKQIFYYDDFLGQTGLDQKLNKNEDQRIVDFCQLCSRSKNTFFLMTTREYILNQAKNTYEKLQRAGLDANKCILNANTYTLLNKAQIFYNHLYFKDVPEEYIQNISHGKSYFQVIRNRSFNPRVIETVTEKSFIERSDPSNYINDIVSLLNMPHIIWEHAYKEQLNQSSRHLLIVVLSCLSEIKLADCITLFNIFSENYVKQYGGVHSPTDFYKSLKECEGDFLEISLNKNIQIIGFRNPSVRDYLTFYLSQEINLLKVLIESITNFTQVRSLWNSFRPLEDNPLEKEENLLQLFMDKAAQTIDTKNIAVSKIRHSGGIVMYSYLETDILDHCSFVLRMKLEQPTSALSEIIIRHYDNFYDRSNLIKLYDWEKHISNLKLIRDNIKQFSLKYDKYLEAVLDILPKQLNQVADYKALADLCEWSNTARSRLTEEFEDFILQLNSNFDDEINYVISVDDVLTLEDYKTNLTQINKVFGQVNGIDDLIYEVSNHIGEIYDQQEEEEVEQSRNRRINPDTNIIQQQAVISLFETL